MKSKVGITLMTIGAMLIVSALSLVVYNIYTDKAAEKQSHNIIVTLEEEISKHTPNNTDLYDIGSVNYDNGDSEAGTIVINNNEYIGIIYIPTINIKLPVMKEWNYDNLKISPCRYTGNVSEDNLIIAAHNYSSHFGQLKNLIYDDEIYFIDANGKKYGYIVSSIEIVNGSDVEKMLAGEWPLTLFTCNFNGTNRVTIRCDYK